MPPTLARSKKAPALLRSLPFAFALGLLFLSSRVVAQTSLPVPPGLVGTRWTFPVKGKPREEKWIEFRADGVLGIGWESTPRTWRPLSAGRVEIHPYTSPHFTFVILPSESFQWGFVVLRLRTLTSI